MRVCNGAGGGGSSSSSALLQHHCTIFGGAALAAAAILHLLCGIIAGCSKHACRQCQTGWAVPQWHCSGCPAHQQVSMVPA